MPPLAMIARVTAIISTTRAVLDRKYCSRPKRALKPKMKSSMDMLPFPGSLFAKRLRRMKDGDPATFYGFGTVCRIINKHFRSLSSSWITSSAFSPRLAHGGQDLRDIALERAGLVLQRGSGCECLFVTAGFKNSDPEETVGRVAAKLLDETVFPIEMGLHRLVRDADAFIGPPVALRRIRLGQRLRRAHFKRAIVATV